MNTPPSTTMTTPNELVQRIAEKIARSIYPNGIGHYCYSTDEENQRAKERDWKAAANSFAALLAAELLSSEAALAPMEQELKQEQERSGLQLAACDCAAMMDLAESHAKNKDVVRGNLAWSPAFDSVMRRTAECIALRAANAKLAEELASRDTALKESQLQEVATTGQLQEALERAGKAEELARNRLVLWESTESALAAATERIKELEAVDEKRREVMTKYGTELAAANKEVERLKEAEIHIPTPAENEAEFIALRAAYFDRGERIEQLTAQLAAGAADSRRLDWLEEDVSRLDDVIAIAVCQIAPPPLRAAIDAATRATEERT